MHLTAFAVAVREDTDTVMDTPFLYRISGEVIRGKSLGRQFGFPTANIAVADDAPLPNGVYAAYAEIDGRRFGAVANVGRRPTVDMQGERLAEIYFLGFDGDLYGRKLDIRLTAFIRNECKFADLDQLKQQIRQDVERAAKYFVQFDK